MEVDKNEEDDDFSSFESDSTISSKSSNGKVRTPLFLSTMGK